ncbi:hypothetical protein M9H77_24141 [Catharanthus roseus]|uniref:Uncharacterized protein n=1 Tax=Catharanthus roseus TaxID=4058 RepID=A0ACC0AY12_CATRO|nr:hypothetical protein M9H77_24141 [Catharanthus roseus]
MYKISNNSIQIEQLKSSMSHANEQHIQRIYNEKFLEWFKTYVQEQRRKFNAIFSEEENALAIDLNLEGRRFCTKSLEISRTTQNSGVLVRAETLSYVSSRDRNHIVGDVEYYGYLTDIIELTYNSRLKFVLFKFDWVHDQRGVKEDMFKFTLEEDNMWVREGAETMILDVVDNAAGQE